MVSVNSSWGTSDLERERSCHKIQPRLVACHCFIHQSVFHNFVEDFIIRIITSPFLYLSPTMVAQGEKWKVKFSRKPLVRFSQIIFWAFPPTRSTERHEPPTPFGGGARGPKLLGQLKKSPISGFRGQNFCLQKLWTDEPINFWGPFPGWQMGFCPHAPKTNFICGTFSRKTAGQIWTKLKIYTLQILYCVK